MENPQNTNFNKIDSKSRIFYFIFLFFILIFILLLGYFLSALSPISQISDIKQIEIKDGESFRQIAADLEGVGIIKSGLAFQFFSLISGSAHKLKPGLYSFDASLPALNVLKNLIIGPDREKEVIIPPGFTLLDIDKKLSEVGVLAPGDLANFDIETISAPLSGAGSASGGKNDYEFLFAGGKEVDLEGYLFPDTYKFFIKSKPEDAVKKFLDNFSKKAWPVLLTNNSRLTTNDILIIASLIEREVYFSEDKPIVSGIIYKRLKIVMPLQIDATIVYAKCKGLLFYCSNPSISKTETKYQSLYNTYLYKGLPPTPISNPGLDSINAALNPEDSIFLYYLSDPKTYKLIFSKTLEEHNKNRELYLVF